MLKTTKAVVNMLEINWLRRNELNPDILLFHVTCESDVTYYPFDEHKCTIMVLTADALNDLTVALMPL
jgi:hypothetical protein